MTLREMKIKIYSMIEELDESLEDLTADPDFALKMNSVINQIQNELSRIKKIDGYSKIEVEKDQEMNFIDIDDAFYQLDIIKDIEHDIYGNTIHFNEDGIAKILYYKYPTQINEETEDDFEFNLTTDVLEIMPYGVAGDLLKSDVSNSYGQIYSQRYEAMKRELDPRINLGSFYIEGGIDV